MQQAEPGWELCELAAPCTRCTVAGFPVCSSLIMSFRRQQFLIYVLAMLVTLPGCSPAVTNGGSNKSALRLAVTTSTRDSGLLDELVPVFERQAQVRVDVVAVGTGAALTLGQAGDVDVILVHAREAEDEFMAGGHGVRREDLMFNTFVILGPENDPAAVASLEPVSALQQIAGGKHRFVSRGDDSGTHQRETKLWADGGGLPEWENFVESGQGMGATLTMADQMNAYVLTDRGTYLRFKEKIRLVPLGAASECLRNPYGVIVVNPDKHQGHDDKLAHAFVDFLVSPQAQALIGDYQLHGEPLFHPLRLQD